MAELFYTTIEKYKISAVCTAPLHIGSAVGEKSEVLVHPITGLPFIQASSLCGVLRATSEKLNGSDVTAQIFGASRMESGGNAQESASRLRISDGSFDISTVSMEYRPRVAINPETGTVSTSTLAGNGRSAGHKFEMESIGKGAEITFVLYLYDDGTMKNSLEKVLAELKAEHLQFGGQKSNGSGYMALKSLKHKSFLMTDKDERKKWVSEDTLSEDEYEDLTNQLEQPDQSVIAYEITLTGKTESGLLVKAIAAEGFGSDAADTVNMTDSSGDYIVPGSSLKGAIRNQMTMIAKRLHKGFLIDNIFGKGGEKKKRGATGCISIKDSVVGEKLDNKSAAIQHRIHIDKFTGGVISQSLFSERDIYGDTIISIQISDKKNADAAAALVIYALRDLSAGLMNLGSGYANGKGFIDVSKIQIASLKNQAEAEIDLKNKSITDSAGIIKSCLKALSDIKEA